MSLFKKFLGKKEEKAPKSQQQRSPRVRIPLVDDTVFVAANGKRYVIRNLSETGMAILSPGERFPDEVNGDIHVGGQSVYVELATVRRNGDEAGVTFQDGAVAVRGLLRRVFTDEFHALEMTEVDANRQKPAEVGEPKWFYAPGNYELYFVEHEGKLIRFEIAWSGALLSFDGSTLRFGTVDEEVRGSPSHARSALVNWSGELDEKVKQKAIRLIENVPGLDDSVRKRIQQILKG